MGKDKWWKKFRAIADDILQWDRCYCKEKYWRFDTSYYGTIDGWRREWVQDRLHKEVENESEKCCQLCARHRYQVWVDWWWIEHYCIICLIKKYIIRIKNKFIYLMRQLWRKIF